MLSPFLNTIVSNMFKYADLEIDINKIDFKDEKDPYYHKYSWNKKQEESFKKWMIHYLTTNKPAREYLLNRPKVTKKHLTQAVDEFLFCHGLRTI